MNFIFLNFHKKPLSGGAGVRSVDGVDGVDGE